MRLFRERFAIFAFIGLSLIFSGCKKKDLTYTVSGTIHDVTFNNSLEGAQVKIYSSGSADDNFSTTITTGADGTYSYTFPRRNYTDITIEVSKGNYFGSKKTFILDDLSVNEGNTFNFDLETKAWVKLHFLADGVKDVKFGRIEGYGGCDECCDGTEQVITDCTDYEYLCLNKGNKVYKIYYSVIGSSENGIVEVTTVPFEYTELLVDLQ